MTGQPIILITGCTKYLTYLQAAIQRFEDNTFAEVIGFIGDPSTTDATFDPETHILTLPVSDIYEALPQKIHAAFSWIARERPNRGIFKTDDDIVFDVPELAKAIQTNYKESYWGVAVGNCQSGPVNKIRIDLRFNDTMLRPNHQSALYCFGWGYWVSPATISYIVAAGGEYRSSFLEDVCTGYVLNRAGVYPKKLRIPFKEYPRNEELLAIK